MSRAWKRSPLAAHATLAIHVVDLLRTRGLGAATDRTWLRVLAAISAGRYVMVLAAPPAGTWSRARDSTTPGPPALRSAEHPWGFPRLPPSQRKACLKGNNAVLRCVDAVDRQLSLGGLALLAHPEDLGRRQHGHRPASIWQLEVTKALLSKHPAAASVGWLQSSFGAAFAKPSRCIANLETVRSDARVHSQRPAFDGQGRYRGPLSVGKGAPTLIGRDASRAFVTARTALWPLGFRNWLAQQVLLAASHPPLPPTVPPPTALGGGAAARPLWVRGPVAGRMVAWLQVGRWPRHRVPRGKRVRPRRRPRRAPPFTTRRRHRVPRVGGPRGRSRQLGPRVGR